LYNDGFSKKMSTSATSGAVNTGPAKVLLLR
jgi:hypothetical protein